MPIDPLGYALLAVARDAINQRLGNDVAPTILHPALDQAGATFVTLTQHGTLRGCIGSLEAYRPLATDVAENAVAAAFADPRFSPLSLAEWKETRIEVSLLDAAEEMRFVDENDAIDQLRPGIDGLILRHGVRHATFLPQVWEALPEPRQFLAQLKQKAGLTADFWDDDMHLDRYGVQKWKES